MTHAHIARLIEEQLALLLRIVETAALLLEMNDNRPPEVDVAIAALQSFGAKKDVVAGDRERRIKAAKLLKQLAPDGEACASNGRDLMRRGSKSTISVIVLEQTHMSVAGDALDTNDC